MKQLCLTIMTIMTFSIASAESSYLLNGSLGEFAAPVVPTVSGLTNLGVGTIVFDLTNQRFSGLNDSGSWVSLSAPGGKEVVFSSGTTERMERARIEGGATPTITAQSGSWLNTTITRNGTGDYTLSVNTAFSAPPACTITPANSGTNQYTCHLLSISTSSVRTYCVLDNGTPAPYDLSYHIICMGPL